MSTALTSATPVRNKWLANKMLPFLQKNSPLMPDDRWILKSLRAMYATIPALRRDVRTGGLLVAAVSGVTVVGISAGIATAALGVLTIAGAAAGVAAVVGTAGFAYWRGQKLAARFQNETAPQLLEDIKVRYGEYKKQEMMAAILRRQHDSAVKKAIAKGEAPPAPLPVEPTGPLSKREALKILFGRAGKIKQPAASVAAPAPKAPVL